MADFSNILVCTDFSEHSDKAVDMAMRMADGAKVTALHVVPAAYDYSQMGVGLGTVTPLGSLDTIKGKLRERYASSGAEIEVAVEQGNPAERIISFAQEKGADVIVIGARGVGFLTGLMSGGSVAEKVVRNAKVPVLVIPA